MKTFYITFGVQYTDFYPHPNGGHRDGWFEIKATNELEAREKAFASPIGRQWSMMYDKQPDLEVFPRGCLQTIE